MLSIFFITIARDAHYKNKQDKDMKRLILLIIIISISFVACSTGTKSPLKMQNANVGEKVYKEVSVNGETISKWLTVSEISEYDNKGNKIHYKTSYGTEDWFEYEYDSHSNKIQYKETTGYKEQWEYDIKGNNIHYKASTGYEKWMKYDSKGNMIYSKNSNNDEWWNEYDTKGNMIH